MVKGHCLAILISLIIAASTTVLAQGGYSVSSDGLNFIAQHEGIEYNLYNDPAGHCTIGVGHLVHSGYCDGSDPSEQEFLGGITRDQAFELLRSDVAVAEQAVNTYVTVPLTQAQFDALVSFTYNLGAGNFRNSDLLEKLNAGQYDAVPQELNKWIYGGGKVLPGLVTRRSDEGTLFQSEGLPSGTIATVDALLVGTSQFVPLDTQETGSTYQPDQESETEMDDATYWAQRAYDLQNQNRWEEALQALEKSIELDPDDTEVWRNKGVTLYFLGRYDEAIQATEKAIEIDPRNTNAVNQRDQFIQEQGT
jgi:lysozyme